jgi:hypothetical protein
MKILVLYFHVVTAPAFRVWVHIIKLFFSTGPDFVFFPRLAYFAFRGKAEFGIIISMCVSVITFKQLKDFHEIWCRCQTV